jgi:hypothetical protein
MANETRRSERQREIRRLVDAYVEQLKKQRQARPPPPKDDGAVWYVFLLAAVSSWIAAWLGFALVARANDVLLAVVAGIAGLIVGLAYAGAVVWALDAVSHVAAAPNTASKPEGRHGEALGLVFFVVVTIPPPVLTLMTCLWLPPQWG